MYTNVGFTLYLAHLPSNIRHHSEFLRLTIRGLFILKMHGLAYLPQADSAARRAYLPVADSPRP